MTVPDFQSMMRPVLALHADGLPHSAADVREDVATVLGVTEEERQVPLPSGRTTRYANRVAWAVTHMAQALLLERPARGVTQITQRGRDVLTKHPDRVDMSVLAQFPEYLAFRSRTRQPLRDRDSRSAAEEPTHDLSPSEAMTTVVDEAHSAVAGDVLARILLRPPQFLERLVLKLLVNMGYGGLEAVTEHLGGPGDQGLDGSSARTRLAWTWCTSRPSAMPRIGRLAGRTFRGSRGRCRGRRHHGGSSSPPAASAQTPGDTQIGSTLASSSSTGRSWRS